MPKRSKFLLTGLVWMAAFLRIHALFTNHFQADEALFASWARLIAIWRDPLLQLQDIDKPPLLFYLQALFYPLFGPVEWAARFPNYIASLLFIPLVAVLSWHLYRDQLGMILTALIIVFAPLTIQFSSSAFTDPLLSFLIVGSILFVIYKPSPAFSGLVFGLAAATKYQAWLFLPLLVGMAWLKSWSLPQVRRWFLGLIPVSLSLIIWETIRNGTFSLWSRQLNNFGGVRLAWSWELFRRLKDWTNLWHVSLGNWIFIGLFLLAVCIIVLRAIQERDVEANQDLLLILFIGGYLIVHWLLAVPVWDRYILPLLPFVAIVFGRGISTALRWAEKFLSEQFNSKSKLVKGAIPSLFFLLVLILFLPEAIAAREGNYPLGGLPAADQGAWQIAEFLADEPYGTVLYDHWYSWQWQYHLLDKKVYISWFIYPEGLVEDLDVFGRTVDRRFVVLPATNAALPVIRKMNEAGYDLNQVLKTEYDPGMILYQVQYRGEAR